MRVATIDSIRYLDARNTANMTSIFGTENKAALDLLGIVRAVMAEKIQAFNLLYGEAMHFDMNKLEQEVGTDPENPLFVNAAKKEIILKNMLLKRIIVALQQIKQDAHIEQ